jgi:diguanylate cyclase (GGDEF)-like protein/PAS domain S-box-containing protein
MAEPASHEAGRRAWRPGAAVGARVALVVVIIAGVAALVAALMGASSPSAVGTWASRTLFVVSLLGVAVARWRSRVEANRHWGLLVIAFLVSSVAEGLLSIRASSWLYEQWPSLVDAFVIGFYAVLVWFFVGHLFVGDRRNAFVHLADSLIFSLGITFVLWEAVIHPGLGEISRYSATTQVMVVLYPFVDVFVASILLFLLLVARSPARVVAFGAMVAMTVADTLASANWFTSSGRMVIGGVLWVVAFGGIVVALALPAGAEVAPRRPTVLRLLLVQGSLTIGMWLATWQFILHDAPTSVVAATIALLAGGSFSASQLAGHRQSSRWAEQLGEHIVQLKSAEEELRHLLDDLPNAVVVLDSDGRMVEVNDSAVELTGRSRDDLLGRSFIEIFDDAHHPVLFGLWQRLHEGGPMERPTLRVERPDGSEVLLEADAILPVRDPRRMTIALRDVTEGVAAADRLNRARERFRLAFHGAPTGMALSSVPDRVILDVNVSLERMLGRDRDALVGRTIDDITHPDDTADLPELMRAVTSHDVEHYRLEKRYLRGDGGVVWARTWVSVMDDGEGGSLAIAHIEDVTERRHNEERLEWAASHDGLTGLPNRFRFLERLGMYLDSAAPGSIAVLFIDLDNFKVINDSLGHDAGDHLLQAMAERLRAVVRDRDMLGRFGGDEFIVMLRDVSGADDPLDIADRLRREIARPVIVDGAELFVTASIGITLADRDGVTTTELLRDADAAMYRAKARGRDCVEVFSPDSHDETVLTLRTTNELRRGLERGEIVPYYQPIVDLGSGQLVGFEVLARWRHPDRGLLGPDQFLPMAEETGLIGEVGAAVLRSSLVHLGQWRNGNRRFADLTVSVNVSVRQLMSNELVGVVSQALAEAGVPANGLWLEITATALMADVKAATVALRDLRSLGLHLAVDDFGTGYSSLTYLKRFPVEAIKVDRTFVNGLGIDAEDSTIVEAVINLGHSLGLSVVAEGVETPLQLTRLRELGCDRGQGYLLGRPRPAELIEAEYSLV